MPAIDIPSSLKPAHDSIRGIDFGKLARDLAALGLMEDGPEWTEALDDPALSRRVLGLDAE
jgi:hypothetical protein